MRNIKLKKIIFVAFVFLFSLHPNVARENHNNKINLIKTVTKKIIGRDGLFFGFRGNIIDWGCTSVYNHYTKHNEKNTGLYRGQFSIYGGLKIKITKNIYLDIYYSLLKLLSLLFFDGFIYNCQYLIPLIPVSFLTFSINIRVYKNFYLAISPIHYILLKLIELRKYGFFARTS